MSAVCPSRHYSYTQWRLHVFRGIFCARPLPSCLQATAGPHTNPFGNRRNFTVGPGPSSPQCGQWVPTEKKDKGDDEDIFAIIKDITRRMASPPGTVPSTSRYTPMQPRGRPNQGVRKSEGRPSKKKSRSQKAKGGKVASQKPKHIEAEENAAFLEEATKRVTGLQIPIQTGAPDVPSDSSTQLARMQKRVEEEEATRPINAGRTAQTQDFPATRPINAGRTAQTQDFPATRPINAGRTAQTQDFPATRPINTGSTAQTHHFPATASESIPSAEEASGTLSGTHDTISFESAGVVERLDSTVGETTSQGQGRHESSGDELQRWFREARERAESHEEYLKTSLSDLSRRPAPVSALNSRASTRVPRPLEPWRIRAAKAGRLGKSFATHAGQADLIAESNLHNSAVMINGTLSNSKHSTTENDRNVSVEHSQRVESVKSGTERNTLLDATAKENSSVLATVNGGRSGILSSSEHDGLSSLLQSLQPQPAESRNVSGSVAQRNECFKSLSKPLPQSPFQRLKVKGRRMKKQATAEGKKRLQENPWAQWLASPIRLCQATGVRLPKSALVGWSYVRNPKDDQVYLMPEELANMDQLDSGSSSRPVAGHNSDSGSFQEAGSGSAEQAGPNGQPMPMHINRPDEVANPRTESVDEDSSKSNHRGRSHRSKRQSPLTPTKVYMQSSSTLVQELTRRMTVAKRRGSAEGHDNSILTKETHLSAVNRLIPLRWKDQARMFEKTADAKLPQAAILTPKKMRNVQWHPDIDQIMLNLLRVRVLKALEGVAVRNSHHTGPSRRLMPLSSGEKETSVEEAVTTTISGLDQAIFLWLGRDDSCRNPSPGTTSPSPSHSPPVDASACRSMTLRFMPRHHAPAGFQADEQPSTKQVEASEQTFIPFWTHSTHSLEPDHQHPEPSRHQSPYIPPSISLHLPIANHNDTVTNHPATIPHPRLRNLPIFNLFRLLGAPSIAKLHATPSVAQALVSGLGGGGGGGGGGGWVMVKGGKETRGFTVLVREVWRLWLFVGGRGFGGVEEEGEKEEKEEKGEEGDVGGKEGEKVEVAG